MNISDFEKIIKNKFLEKASMETKKQYSKYFKNVVKFYGLKSPIIKSIFKKQWEEIKKLDIENKINLSFKLLESKYQDEIRYK